MRRKITFGYALAVAIPVAGALTGLLVGNHYQKQATQTLAATYQEQKLLNNLQVTILQNRPAKELTPFVEDAVAFRQASDAIRLRLQQLQLLIAQLEKAQTKTLISFGPNLQDYQKTVTAFSQEFEELMQESQVLQEQQQYGLLKQEILALVNGDRFSQLLQFADQIDGVAAAVDADVRTAQSQMQGAEALRLQIILGSLIASVIAAGLLAMITSQAIARPLESLTGIAQQVTREGDIDLRAPVLTQDEVGTLASAINQLLEWIHTYTEELNNTQLYLVQTEKMSSLGQLVAGVAHEINNPVNFVAGNIVHVDRYAKDLLTIIQEYQLHYPHPPQILQDTLDDADLDFLSEDLMKVLQSMKVGTERIRQIVLSLRNFSRLDESEFKAVDLHEGIDSTLLILQHRLKAGPETPAINVMKNYGQLPLVECYPAQLNQVFMNILVNAIDAIQEVNQQQEKQDAKTAPGTIWISTQLVAENNVCITIADDGPGIPETVRSRIFDPFFTTKPMSKGTGLGLSISYQIITEKHQGQLRCDSTVNQGTKFAIEIPVHQPQPPI